jgi:hypothetical protein
MDRPQIDFEHTPADSLAAVLESAAEFGVTPNEIWETVVALPDRLPSDIRARYIDEIAAELARRLLEKERVS